jgi:thiosulfate/3-mercaptopyruvate sulfurtransferase
MAISDLPLVLDPQQLHRLSGTPGLLIIDLCKADTYARQHILGAVHLDYARIVAENKPVQGLLPDPDTLSALLAAHGISPDIWVVACDDEGGGKAGRLLWTLDSIGHHRHSLLDGGLIAWINEGHAVDSLPTLPQAVSPYPVSCDTAPVAGRDYILQHLGDPGVRLLDARSTAEFTGEKKLALRGGHIPGAIHYEWTDAMDKQNNFRLRPSAELRNDLDRLGVTPDRQIITYCQTHHRSSLIYVVLKHLGYDKVKGYPGSWSDWGNRQDTPVE